MRVDIPSLPGAELRIPTAFSRLYDLAYNLWWSWDAMNQLWRSISPELWTQYRNPVEMLGMEIGKVSQFKMDQEEQLAEVELKINNGINIYDDAIASIKTAGLIGDKYVSIDAGGGGDLLEPGDRITETEAPADIGDLISKYAFGDVEKE